MSATAASQSESSASSSSSTSSNKRSHSTVFLGASHVSGRTTLMANLLKHHPKVYSTEQLQQATAFSQEVAETRDKIPKNQYSPTAPLSCGPETAHCLQSSLLLDNTKEERTRGGTTVDTKSVSFVLAEGNEDLERVESFVDTGHNSKHVMKGIAEADSAVICLSPVHTDSKNQFSAPPYSTSAEAPVKVLLKLAIGSGITKFIFVITKMDQVKYDQKEFQVARESIKTLLNQVFGRPEDAKKFVEQQGEHKLLFIPCSCFASATSASNAEQKTLNVTERPPQEKAKNPFPWYEGPCVLEAITDYFSSDSQLFSDKVHRPLRMFVEKIIKTRQKPKLAPVSESSSSSSGSSLGSGSGSSHLNIVDETEDPRIGAPVVVAKIVSGMIKVNDPLLFLKADTVVTVLEIQRGESRELVEQAVAGDTISFVALGITKKNEKEVHSGDVLSLAYDSPLSLVEDFEGDLQVLKSPMFANYNSRMPRNYEPTCNVQSLVTTIRLDKYFDPYVLSSGAKVEPTQQDLELKAGYNSSTYCRRRGVKDKVAKASSLAERQEVTSVKQENGATAVCHFVKPIPLEEVDHDTMGLSRVILRDNECVIGYISVKKILKYANSGRTATWLRRRIIFRIRCFGGGGGAFRSASSSNNNSRANSNVEGEGEQVVVKNKKEGGGRLHEVFSECYNALVTIGHMIA